MLTVKFSNSDRLTPKIRSALGIGATAIVAIAVGTGAFAADNKPVPPANLVPAKSSKPQIAAETTTPPRAARVSPERHLETMDRLRAELEVAKLERDIAKTKAEALEAKSPALSAMPPLPGAISLMPPTSLDTPPLPPARSDSSPDARLLEAWGSGADRQARISTNGGDRIVKIGDQVAGGRVVSITGSAVVIDIRGKRKAIQ